MTANLLGDGGELHDVQRLVVGGGALVDVDDHGRSASATEDGLEEFGQLALSERDVAALCSVGQTDRQNTVCEILTLGPKHSSSRAS